MLSLISSSREKKKKETLKGKKWWERWDIKKESHLIGNDIKDITKRRRKKIKFLRWMEKKIIKIEGEGNVNILRF